LFQKKLAGSQSGKDNRQKGLDMKAIPTEALEWLIEKIRRQKRRERIWALLTFGLSNVFKKKHY
jgi:hypothetical protein